MKYNLEQCCLLCLGPKKRNEWVCPACWAQVPTDQKMLWKLTSNQQHMKMLRRWIKTGWH